MAFWRFLDFMRSRNRNAIQDWYGKLPSDEARADFDALIDNLEVINQWQEPAFKRLTGRKYRGLGELRFKTGNVQHRVIGYQGPGFRQFTLLIGCTHKQRVYKPANALDTAAKRMRLVQAGERNVCHHETTISDTET